MDWCKNGADNHICRVCDLKAALDILAQCVRVKITFALFNYSNRYLKDNYCSVFGVLYCKVYLLNDDVHISSVNILEVILKT